MTEHATQTAIVRRTVLTLSELPPSANNLHRHFERGGKIIRVKTSRCDGLWISLEVVL